MIAALAVKGNLVSGIHESSLPTAVIVVALLIVIKVAILYMRWWTTPLNRIPGPTHTFLAGSLPEIVKRPFMAPHVEWLEAQRKIHGDDLPLLHYTTPMGQQSLLVLDKNIVQKMLTAPECSSKRTGPRFVKPNTGLLRSRVGDGLATLGGRDWMRHRRIIQPSFNTGLLRDRLEEVVPPIADRLVACWRKAAGTEIDVSSHMSAATLDVVGIVLFSHEFRAMRGLEEWAEIAAEGEGSADSPDGAATVINPNDSFFSSFTEVFKVNFLTLLLDMMSVSKWEPILNLPVRRRARALDRAVDQVLKNAKEQCSPKIAKNAGENNGKGSNKSLLHLLFEAQDPSQEGSSNTRRLSWQELRDETKTFLLGGFETTATWLYWVMYALAKYPDVQEKLHREINTLGRDASKNTLEEIERVEYLNAVMNEVLRLYSPAGMILRSTTGPETLAGYEVPPSTRLALSFFLLHRHPAYWDDPESFLPERWADATPQELERRKFAFLPFSAGGRNCIGQRFAWMEARLLLVPILRNFVVQIAPSQRDVQHSFTNRITMKTRPALKIIVKPRG